MTATQNSETLAGRASRSSSSYMMRFWRYLVDRPSPDPGAPTVVAEGTEMTGEIEARLRQLDLELPQPSAPGANYVPFVRTGNLVFVTGQLSQWNGERRFIGKLGREFGIEEGQSAARLCALNVIAQLRVALDGDLDRVVQCVRIAGFVNSMPDFDGQSQVVDGASDAFIDVFGAAGRHARTAVGVAALPYGVAVEVEGTFEAS